MRYHNPLKKIAAIASTIIAVLICMIDCEFNLANFSADVIKKRLKNVFASRHKIPKTPEAVAAVIGFGALFFSRPSSATIKTIMQNADISFRMS